MQNTFPNNYYNLNLDLYCEPPGIDIEIEG
jgi:hypothetical protein